MHFVALQPAIVVRVVAAARLVAERQRCDIARQRRGFVVVEEIFRSQCPRPAGLDWETTKTKLEYIHIVFVDRVCIFIDRRRQFESLCRSYLLLLRKIQYIGYQSRKGLTEISLINLRSNVVF